MPLRENLSYLVPRDPSIKCWGDRVKLPGPCTKNLIQLEMEEFEETMGDKIKVYLRLKPSSCAYNPYTVLNSGTLQTEAPKDSISYRNVTNGVGKLIHKFTFTSVLDQDITQANLFKKCAVKSLKTFLSGENYLLMAYGTTSAGKTFTMQGNVEQPGVIPRALDFVFTALKDNIIPLSLYQPHQYQELIRVGEEQMRKDLNHKNFILSLDLTKHQRYPDTTVQTMSSSGFSDMYENVTFKEMKTNLSETESFELNSTACKYSVWVSMIEIYNEQVYDLLEVPTENGMRPKLAFKDDECGNTFVKNLRYVNVLSGHEAFQILQFGRSNLHMAPTALNERSSRSHCIFMITLAKFLNHQLSSKAVLSRFSFCDLAGMERAKKTLNVKDRLVESKAINTSLSILVKCLVTIKENQSNREKKMIPYRESKLTKLFRDAIMGKEQFSLIVNVTSEPNLFDETLNVLKFSSIAQKIVPQNVFVKPRPRKPVEKSRFSQILMSAGSSSNPIDWEAYAVADAKVKYRKHESAYSSQVEDLQKSVDRLREELAREKERCLKIEEDIREELTSNFSEILRKTNESHKAVLEDQNERHREMYERKQNRIIAYYEEMKKNRLQKLEQEDLEDYAEEMEKLKKVKEELDSVKLENEASRQRIQELVIENEKNVSESMRLTCSLIEKERLLEFMQRSNEASDVLVKELRKQLEEATTKITNFKSLLQEAASDNSELEENNKFLRSENEVLEEMLTEHANNVADLKKEISDLQDILTQKRMEEENEMREELKAEEGKSEETQPSVYTQELHILRDQLKKTSEKLIESRAELEIVKTEKLNLEKDLEISQLKMADLESKALRLEKNHEGQEEMERKMAELEEQVEILRNVEAEAEVLASEKENLEEKCNELGSEVKILQKELKDLITSKKESDRVAEIEALTKENERIQKELLSVRKRNAELEEELKEQIENWKARERESKITVEGLKTKLEAVEYQNSVLKNLKDEAERQAYEVPQLHEEIKKLEKEIENRERELVSFNENRQQIFNNYEKEVMKLKEENERLRKDVLFANEVIAKNMTPLKTDKAEISRLKESVKKKEEEIIKLKVEVDSIKKAERGDESNEEKSVVSNSSSGKEDSLFVSLNNKKHWKRECTPERPTKEFEAPSLRTKGKSTRKKVDQLEESIHPSTLKNMTRGRKKNEKKEKEAEKENIPTKKNNRCHKQLFSENDFDGLTDLNAIPLEQEIPRLRPRK